MTQLRACYRAAVAGPVKVMAPMVADAGDVDVAAGASPRARDGSRPEGIAIGEIDLGVMLEIPSAVLIGDSWFERTCVREPRDERPTQYTLAVDRGNPALERYVTRCTRPSCG